MNRTGYLRTIKGEKILEQMDLLQIMDITTTRQHKNGTIVWRLPIKYSTHPKFIEVASFATGYVRNQNGGYSNYQLNKRCDGEPEYFQLASGDYRRFSTRSCILIPNEKDRLEYLIAYCLKNYYIKNANEVAEGNYIAKCDYEWQMKQAGIGYATNKDLENKLAKIKRIADNG